MPTSGLPRFVENILAVGTRKSFIYIADKLYMRSGLLISNFNAHCAALQNRMKFVHDVLLSKHLLRSVRANIALTQEAKGYHLAPAKSCLLAQCLCMFINCKTSNYYI